MVNRSSHYIKTAGQIKAVLKQNGKYTVQTVETEASLLLKVLDIGITFCLLWKSDVEDGVMPTIEHPAGEIEKVIPLIVTRRLSQSAFEKSRLKKQCVFDEYGNGLILAPGIWYERFVVRSENRRISVSGTPFTAKASRIVRALLSRPEHRWSQGTLAAATGITQGYASRCLAMLVSAGYCVETGNGYRLETPDRLLDDWAGHYRFDRHQQYRYAFSSASYDEGMQRLGNELGKTGIQYAFTGWSGAHLRAPYAVPPAIMTFVGQLPADPGKMGLYPVDRSENVILMIPHDNGVFQFTQTIGSVIAAADSQIYIDLRRMPGRSQEQAEAFREQRLKWKDIDNA